ISVTGGGYSITGNSVTLVLGVTADFALSSDSTLGLNLGGLGGITKSGTGRLVLSGDNTYSGATTISNGIIQARTPTALGAAGVGNETIVLGPNFTNVGSLEMATGSVAVPESITFSDDAQLTVLDPGAVFSGPITLTGTTSGTVTSFRNSQRSF